MDTDAIRFATALGASHAGMFGAGLVSGLLLAHWLGTRKRK